MEAQLLAEQVDLVSAVLVVLPPTVVTQPQTEVVEAEVRVLEHQELAETVAPVK